jgi:hypothetical protein
MVVSLASYNSPGFGVLELNYVKNIGDVPLQSKNIPVTQTK